MKPLEAYLIPTQEQLFLELCARYRGRAKVRKGSYILVRGEAPIMLIAHLDTVHAAPVKDICKTRNGTILMSPQGIGGDDRCGVFALNTVYERAEVKPWLLFTCDEETGGVGAKAFCDSHQLGKLPKSLEKIKILVEIDRKGRNDAVYYDCENDEFEEYITSKGFKTSWGSFSDISVIAPELGVAAVNLSSGYYNAHTPHEYINRKHLNSTVNRVLSIVADAAKPSFPRYEYIEAEHYCYDFGMYDFGRGHYSKLGMIADDPDPDLLKIPSTIRPEYEALLGYYTADYLEKIREDNGDGMIELLFEAEFGGTFDDVFGVKEEDDDI